MSPRLMEQRADMLFALYVSQPRPRTIRGTARALRLLGVRGASEHTLARYAARYHWKRRAEAIEDAATEIADTKAAQELRDTYGRHGQFGRGLMALAMTAMQQLFADETKMGQITPAAIARLGDIGTRLERLAITDHARIEQVPSVS